MRNNGAPSSVVVVGGEGEGADGTDDDPILVMKILLGARVTPPG